MVYSHPVSALLDHTCQVAIHDALNMGKTASIDKDMIDACQQLCHFTTVCLEHGFGGFQMLASACALCLCSIKV